MVILDKEICCFLWVSFVLGFCRIVFFEFINIRCMMVDFSSEFNDFVLLVEEV